MVWNPFYSTIPLSDVPESYLTWVSCSYCYVLYLAIPLSEGPKSYPLGFHLEMVRNPSYFAISLSEGPGSYSPSDLLNLN